MKKIVAGVGAFALSLTITSFALADTQSNTINLEVNVQETLAFECHDLAGVAGDYDVDLGTVTAGTPVTGGSRCNVTTNDDSGYYLEVENSTGAAQGGITTVLRHEDPNASGTWYGITDQAAWTEAAIITDNTSNVYTGTGLAFSVIAFPDTNFTNSTFTADTWVDTTCGSGTDVYAGIPSSAATIAAVTQYESGITTTDVCYQVDVPGTQPSGVYSGSVTYTATTDASAYITP